MQFFSIIGVCLLLILTSCASRTPYQPYSEDQGGFRLKTIEENFYIVNFVGNKETSKRTAELFAAFRSIEHCKNDGYLYAHPLYISGDLEEENVIRTSTPSYYGISPYYGALGYPGTAFAGGFGGYGGLGGYYSGRMGTYPRGYPRTYVDTITYPEVTIAFECANKVYEPQLEFEEVSNEEVKKFSKDNDGGVKITSIPEKSLNKTSLKKNDIVLVASGERVETAYGLIKLFGPRKETLEVQILRNGKKINTKMYSVEVTQRNLDYQNEVISQTCDIKDFNHALCK